MQNRLSGSLLVTGAATAAGLSIALAFAEQGCEHIYLGDTSSGGLEASRDHILKKYPSAQVHTQAFDRSDEDAVGDFFSEVIKQLKRIDFAVNIISQTQGLNPSAVPKGHSVEGFDRNFRVYQRGAFLIERALLRQMITQDALAELSDCRGSIVNVVDYGPTPSLADLPVLAMVAFAIIGFSKTDACDYAEDKIRVNCIAASEVLITKTKPELPGGVPLPRKGMPDDIANAAVWLSSPNSSWLTGLVVPVDGGRNLHHWW